MLSRGTFGTRAGASRTKPVILLGVTVDQSLKLLRGQPQFLASNGWEVHVVSAGDSTHPPEYYLGPASDVVIHKLVMSRRPSVARDITSALAWIRLLHHIRPDVVCLGTPKAGLVGLAAAWLLRIPSRIYLLRGLRLEGQQGLSRRALRAFEKLTAAMATHIIAVSDSVSVAAQSEGIGRRKSLQVLGKGSSNGIDIPTQQQLRLLRDQRDAVLLSVGLDPTQPVVGFVGRLTPDKGVHLLADACISLRAMGVPVQLLLVGAEDSPNCQTQLRRALEIGDVPHAMTGYVERPTEFMAAMDVFCLPSLREGMPNVSLEAAALGLPVVTSDATGCRDSVLNNVTGLTFNYERSESLVCGLQTLLEDQGMRTRFGNAGAKWVSENFDRQTVWNLYEDFYRDAYLASCR